MIKLLLAGFGLLLLVPQLFAQQSRCYILGKSGARTGYINEDNTIYPIKWPDGLVFADENPESGFYLDETWSIYLAVYVQYNGVYYRVTYDKKVGLIGRENGDEGSIYNLKEQRVGYVDQATHKIIAIANGREREIGSVEEGRGCDLESKFDLQRSAAAAAVLSSRAFGY